MVVGVLSVQGSLLSLHPSMAAGAVARDHSGGPMADTIDTEPSPMSRTEDRPGGRSLRRANTVTSGDFLEPASWKTRPANLAERRIEKDQQDASVTKTIDSESPLRFRTENRPAVRSLQRCNTVTLGDYLDQMYMDPTSLLTIEKDQQDVSVSKAIHNEPPLCYRMENKPVGMSLQRTNTVTLGDYLDPTYMDPALWKNMPLHLVELILSKVPFRDLVNLRRVCKYWNALILSEGFSPPFVPALIMFARTPTVRKMMWERNQPVPEAKDRCRWSIFRLWSSARRMFKRKPCRCHARCMVHYYH